MKKMLCILLMLMFAFPALAQDANPFAPYALTSPEGAVLEEGEGSLTFVRGSTRVVAQVIARVPDEDPAAAVIRMMTWFEPFAVIGEDLPAAEGFVGVTALNEDKFGDGVDLITVMILGSDGDLLILSAYDLGGDEEAAQLLLDELLCALTAEGQPVVTAKE